jgi:hypothetical protein
VNSASCGYIHSLATRARLLNPKNLTSQQQQQDTNSEQPTILIQSDQHSIFIQRQSGITVAIYKENKQLDDTHDE